MGRALVAIAVAALGCGKPARPEALPELSCPGGRCPALDPARGAALTVSGTGGALDGVRIEIPPRAALAPIAIGAALVPPAGPRPDLAVGPTVRLTPDGARFAAPVTVRMPLGPATALDPSKLIVVGIASTSGAGPRWDLVKPRRIDAGAGQVWFRTRHFSDATPLQIGGDSGLLLVEDDRLIDRPLVEDTARQPDLAAECQRILEGLGPLDERTLEWSYADFSDQLGVGGSAVIGLPGQRTADDVIGLGFYLDAEDGGAMSIGGNDVPIPPLRTTYEVGLFERIKRHVATQPDVPLTPEMLLQMALAAARDGGGRPNAHMAMLTVLNVVRILGRPRMWANDLVDDRGRPCPPEDPQCGRTPGHATHGHPPDDPAYPIFMDLLGVRPSGGGETLLDILRRQGRLQGAAGPQWSQELFATPPGEGFGIFSALPGVTDDEDNAGSHYYFWTGALGRAGLGGAITLAGIVKERVVKEQDGLARPGQGRIQTTNGLRGFQLAECLEMFAPRRAGAAGDAGVDGAADATPADAVATADAASTVDAPRQLAAWVGTWEGSLHETEDTAGKTATRSLPASATIALAGADTLTFTPHPMLNLPPATLAVDAQDERQAFVDGPTPPHVVAACTRTGTYKVDAQLDGDALGVTLRWDADTTCQLSPEQPPHRQRNARVLQGSLRRAR